MKKIAAMAEAYDGKDSDRRTLGRYLETDLPLVAIAPHCPLGPIALAACLQIGICTPNHQIQEMSLGIHYNVAAGSYDIDSYVRNPEVFKVTDGHVDILNGPGLGIEVNEDLVREVAKTAEVWPLGSFYGRDAGLREW